MASRRFNRIVKDRPELDGRADVKEAADDVELYKAIAAFQSSEAGKVIVPALAQDVATEIEALLNGYKTMPETELRATCARIDALIGLVHTFNRAETNAQDADAVLTELLK